VTVAGRVSPITVLHCRASSGRFGPEQALDQVVPALVELDVRPQVLAIYRRPVGGPATHPWIAGARERGLEAHQIADPGPLSLDVVRQLYSRVKSSRCDVLHTHDYKSNVLGGLAVRRADHAIPWVATVHLHTEASRRLRVYRALDLFLLRLADRVITVSREQRRLLLRRGVERRRLVLVPNVIDVAGFSAGAGDPSAVRAELGVPVNAPLIGTVGRLAEQKGVDCFLEAARAVHAARPESRFVIVGGGPLRRALEASAAALDLGGSADFVGYRTDVASLMAACDIVVLPSRSEGLPLVLLEALALGRPVVATRVGGVPDAVRDDESAVLVEPGSATAIASAVLRLLDDPLLCARLGDAGRARVLKRFAPQQAARRLASVYRTVLAERA
jgi:glycosyltransferase involved in cell wall biosynthesis